MNKLLICNRAKPQCRECEHSKPHVENDCCKTQPKCYGSPDGDKPVECVEYKPEID